MSFVERYENLYIFAQQKSRSTSGFSYIWAILDCYGDISALPNGYGGCWHLVRVAQLQLILPSPLLGIKKRLPRAWDSRVYMRFINLWRHLRRES